MDSLWCDRDIFGSFRKPILDQVSRYTYLATVDSPGTFSGDRDINLSRKAESQPHWNDDAIGVDCRLLFQCVRTIIWA